MRASDPRTRRYIGVDLGGTKIAVSIWEEVLDHPDKASVEKLDSVRWPTLGDGPAPNLEKIVKEARGLLERADRRVPGDLAAVGISGGGPLDPVTGTILSIPNLTGWVDVPMGSYLAEHLGAPARLENDANACAVAEWLYGAGRGSSTLVFLTCSTGIGAGLILDGRLHRGSASLAGEAGHQVIVPDGLACGCGNRGCLEAYASGAGMARRLEVLRKRDTSLPSTAREVVERARVGDSFSLEFLRETAEYLARGLVNLIFVLNPDRIVLGTIAVGAGELLLRPLRESLGRLVWPSLLEGLRVVPASLGEELGDRAALAVARDLPALPGDTCTESGQR
jgi:glucokinase